MDRVNDRAKSCSSATIHGCVLTVCILGAVLSFLVARSRYYDLQQSFALLFVLFSLAGAVAGFRLGSRARPQWRRGLAYGLALLLLVAPFTAFYVCIWRHPPGHEKGPRWFLIAHSHRMDSLGQLQTLCRALENYSSDHGLYLPFDERGPLYSLALLYPQYVQDPEGFESPVFSNSWFRRNEGRPSFPADCALAGERCDYAYAWKPYKLDRYFAVMASSPRTFLEDGQPQGFCVLYSDWSARWHCDPFSEINPNDNIYAPDPEWPVDSDTWLRTEPLRRATCNDNGVSGEH